MTCKKGRVTPSPNTKLRLFADSGGYCANPDCLVEIFREIDGEVVHIGEIAHIISAGDAGPRADPKLEAQQRSTYENLLLLCPSCHTIIDKAEEKFPEDLIFGWKQHHKSRIADQFGIRFYASREKAKDALSTLLQENFYIFRKYGPLTDERYNPESSLPEQWLRKIRTRIIPNNRKILCICDVNRKLLTNGEKELLEEFRQHVDDFEAKHLANADQNGREWPDGLDNLFS